MNEFDYNVWSDSDNKLTLTAYQIKKVVLDGQEDYNTDTEKYESITFYLPEDHEEILYLLDVADPEKHLAEHGLEDYDDWVSQEFLDRGATPDKILDFIQNTLQEYQPTEEHWESSDHAGVLVWKLKENA